MTRTKKNPKGGNDIEEDAYPQYAAQAQESLDNLWQREIDAVENMTLVSIETKFGKSFFNFLILILNVF